MRTPQAQVAEFHRATGTPVLSEPTVPTDDRRALRIRLLTEEFDEAVEAMAGDDVAHVAKELADLLYVTYGAALEWGIDLLAVMDAVHASNMAKVGSDGKAARRADGKVLKPDGWEPPDIDAVLRASGTDPFAVPACACPRVVIGSEITESRNWHSACPVHGIEIVRS